MLLKSKFSVEAYFKSVVTPFYPLGQNEERFELTKDGPCINTLKKHYVIDAPGLISVTRGKTPLGSVSTWSAGIHSASDIDQHK